MYISVQARWNAVGDTALQSHVALQTSLLPLAPLELAMLAQELMCLQTTAPASTQSIPQWYYHRKLSSHVCPIAAIAATF